MSKNEVLAEIIEVCKDVFENADLEMTEKSCAADIDEWDSLSHLNLISDLENEFGISFTLDEINNSKNLGELAEVIIKHLN